MPKHPAPDLPPAAEGLRASEWCSSAPVICIGGRGPLDECAALMLAQLLQKHALKASLISRELVSRAAIASFDVEGAAIVYVSYLEITGAPTQMRHMVRRIRWRLPKATIIVGFWPASDTLLNDEGRRQTVGADYCVSSLRDAVTACLETTLKSATGMREVIDSPAAQ